MKLNDLINHKHHFKIQEVITVKTELPSWVLDEQHNGLIYKCDCGVKESWSLSKKDMGSIEHRKLLSYGEVEGLF